MSQGKSDGCATFYRTSRFTLIEKERINLYHDGGRDMDRGNVGIVTVLQDRTRPDKMLCVTNTHVVFNPKRGDIKLAQCAILMHVTAACVARYGGSDKVAVIVLGDFNSSPRSKIMEFCVTGSLEHYGFDRRYISGQINVPPGQDGRVAVVPVQRCKKQPQYAMDIYPVLKDELPQAVQRSIRVEQRVTTTMVGEAPHTVPTDATVTMPQPVAPNPMHMSAFAMRMHEVPHSPSPPTVQTCTEIVETRQYAAITHPLKLTAVFPDEGFTTLQDKGAFTADHILFDRWAMRFA